MSSFYRRVKAFLWAESPSDEAPSCNGLLPGASLPLQPERPELSPNDPSSPFRERPLLPQSFGVQEGRNTDDMNEEDEPSTTDSESDSSEDSEDEEYQRTRDTGILAMRNQLIAAIPEELPERLAGDFTADSFRNACDSLRSELADGLYDHIIGRDLDAVIASLMASRNGTESRTSLVTGNDSPGRDEEPGASFRTRIDGDEGRGRVNFAGNGHESRNSHANSDAMEDELRRFAQEIGMEQAFEESLERSRRSDSPSSGLEAGTNSTPVAQQRPTNDSKPKRSILKRTINIFVEQNLAPLLPPHPQYPGPSITCPICQNPYGDEHVPVLVNGVEGCRGHMFGYACLRSWIGTGRSNSNTCPLCRTQWFEWRRAEVREQMRRWRQTDQRERVERARDDALFAVRTNGASGSSGVTQQLAQM